MRQLTHPYLGLGSVPVAHDRNAGRGPESAEMERIRDEILRLHSMTGPGVDWRAVVECAVAILRDQRKDLQIGCYLCWGLFEREGYTGLAVGLTVMRDMIALYWSSLHPGTDRMRARMACLDWLAENLAARIERVGPRDDDRVALETGINAIVDIEDAMRRHFGQDAPPFGHARRQLAEYMGHLPGPEPETDQTVGATRRNSAPSQTIDHVPEPMASRETVTAARAARSELSEMPGGNAETPSSTNEDDRSAAPRSTPKDARRILTPMERAYRRARLVAAIAVTILVLGLAGAGGGYWYYTYERVATIAEQILSPSPETRAKGLAALEALPDYQRAALLRDHRQAILRHFIRLAETRADHYRMVKANSFLDTAFELYPDSARLTDARARLDKRADNIRADVVERQNKIRDDIRDKLTSALPAETAAAVNTKVDRMVDLIQTARLRDARVVLDDIAGLLPPDDAVITDDIPDLAAFAIVEIAERKAADKRFTRALQFLANGIVFLPDHPLLRATRRRHLTNRSAFLLRRTLARPNELKSLLVRQAALQMRQDAPTRFRVLTESLAPKLAIRLDTIRTRDPERARALRQRALALFEGHPALGVPEHGSA
jgi:predicted component of type VI protein secretion system